MTKMRLRPIERKILQFLVDHVGSAHREKIVCAIADPDSKIVSDYVNGSKGGIPRLMGAWSSRIEGLGLLRVARDGDGRYRAHEITDAGRAALAPHLETAPSKPQKSSVRAISVQKFHDELRAQGVDKLDLAFVCPMCGTVQSARDLIEVGAGKSFDEVEKYLAFSCVGRWTGAGAPRAAPDGEPCNWTLGGLFATHKLEVVTEDGARHPRFEPARPALAQAHAAASAKKRAVLT